MKVGIVTCSKEPDLTKVDQALIPLFLAKGIKAEPVVWNDTSVKWRDFNHLILRSVWDYHLHIHEFSKWLDRLDQLGIPLLNPTSIIRKNYHKFYLKDLREKGVQIVPTLFLKKSNQFSLNDLEKTNWKQAIIKPAISASAYLTELFNIEACHKIENKFRAVAIERDFLIQKFMPEVQTFGELSILFFNRKYSHTMLKTAKSNEFRVQSDFGGTAQLFHPTKNIIEQAFQILSNFEGDILQARVDGVIRNGKFILMEIELIEPQLFFEYSLNSYELFVKSVYNLINPQILR